MASRSQIEADRAFAMELANQESGTAGGGKKKKNKMPPPAGPVDISKARAGRSPGSGGRKGRLSLALPERDDLVRNRSQHQGGGAAAGGNDNLLTRMTSYFALPEDVQKKAHVPKGSVFSLARTESGRVQTLGKTPSGNGPNPNIHRNPHPNPNPNPNPNQ